MSSCHRLPLVKSGWFTQNKSSESFSLQPPSCAPPLPSSFSLVWKKKYKRWLSRQPGREGGSVNHIEESVSGTPWKICRGQGGIEWEACVCVMVRDMNGCPAMNMQLHWPECWDSWSVDNREAVFNMRLRCNKTLKRQIHLSSFAHWGNDPAVTTQLCWILSSIWLLSSCFLWLTNCCFTSNHATLQAGCLVNTVDF